MATRDVSETALNACDLANTGMPVAAIAAVAIALVGVGLLVFIVRGRRARLGGTLVLLLVVVGVLGFTDGSASASAAQPAAATAATAPTTADASASAAVPGTSAEDCPPTGGATGGGSGGPGSGGGAENSLTIIQTSVNAGLAPDASPSELVGEITNHGTASAPIAQVTVSIDAVTTAAGAAPGRCDASDYVLENPEMPLGRTLAPEETAEFRGASIGFSDKSTNQDACKGATLHLLYTSS